MEPKANSGRFIVPLPVEPKAYMVENAPQSESLRFGKQGRESSLIETLH